MKHFQRSIRIILLLTLLISGISVFAQDDSVSVAGSGIVNPLLQDIIDASGTDVEFDITTNGTANGFEALCNGDAVIASASRTITSEENTDCLSNDITYFEFLIAHDVMAVIGNTNDSFLACLTGEQLNTIFAPSATGEFTNWSALNPEAPETDETEGDAVAQQYPDQDVSVFIPADDTLTFFTLDNVVNGFGLRRDATTADIDAIIEGVGSTDGAIGVVPLQAARSAADVYPLQLNLNGTGCSVPDVNAIENDVYTAATSLYVYVNEDQAEALDAFLTYLTSDETALVVEEAGFSAPSVNVLETNRAILRGEETGRAFSEAEPDFQIPPFLAGDLRVGGTSVAYTIANSASSSLTQNQPAGQEGAPTLNVELDFISEAENITAFCKGALDVLFITGGTDFTCEGEAPDAPEFFVESLGTRSVVLVANATDEYATCFSLEQIDTIWSAQATDTIDNWNQVSDAFPEQDMTLFGVNAGNVLSEIMLQPANNNLSVPVRVDTELDNDALYRAAAVANVEGSLTYMSWADYQDVLANNQDGIQLVAVNAADECVFPSEETIDDGTYALSQSLAVVINADSLADSPAQSYAWTLFGDNIANTLDNANFTDYADFQDVREELLVAFNEAEERAAAATEDDAASDSDESDESDESDATTDGDDADPEAEVTEEAGSD